MRGLDFWNWKPAPEASKPAVASDVVSPEAQQKSFDTIWAAVTKISLSSATDYPDEEFVPQLESWRTAILGKTDQQLPVTMREELIKHIDDVERDFNSSEEVVLTAVERLRAATTLQELIVIQNQTGVGEAGRFRIQLPVISRINAVYREQRAKIIAEMEKHGNEVIKAVSVKSLPTPEPPLMTMPSADETYIVKPMELPNGSLPLPQATEMPPETAPIPKENPNV